MLVSFTDDGYVWLDAKITKGDIPFDYPRLSKQIVFSIRSSLAKEVLELAKLGQTLSMAAGSIEPFNDLVITFFTSCFLKDELPFFSLVGFSSNERAALNDVVRRAVVAQLDLLNIKNSPIPIVVDQLDGRARTLSDWINTIGEHFAAKILSGICLYLGQLEESILKQRILFSCRPNLLSLKLVKTIPWAELLPAFQATYSYCTNSDNIKSADAATNCLLLMFQTAMREALDNYAVLHRKKLDSGFFFTEPLVTAKLLVTLATEAESKASHLVLASKVKSLEVQLAAKSAAVAALSTPAVAPVASPGPGPRMLRCVTACKKANRQHYKGTCEFYICAACNKSAPGHTMTRCPLYKCNKCNQTSPGHKDGSCV